MAQVIDTLEDRLRRKGIKKNTAESREWFMKQARKLGSRLRTSQVSRDRDRLTDRPLPGRMYMYQYDPKTKQQLPYWDEFPLVFVVKYYPNGFLGLNLHYLPPRLRLQLFEALLKIANNKKYDETTKLKISWSIIQNLSKSRFVAPTVKRYLYSHLRSRYIEVPPEEWEVAVFLPLERFKGASRSKVWGDSKRSI